MNSFHLETKNLILRDVRPSDLEGMFRLDSNPIVHKYLGNNPRTTMEESEKDINYIIQQYKSNGIGRWAAIEKSSGDFIGWSGLKLNNDITYNNKTNYFDVGYRFIPKYWGNGYATESSIAALEYGFKVLNLKLITGIAEVDNIASNRVLQKIGLQFVNTFKIENVDAHWYELKKEDYEQTVS